MELKIIILRKLFRHRIIGGKHTAVEHLTKGLPKHIVGTAKDAVRELIKEGFILSKPTSYGLQVSLNPKKIEEITKLIENDCDDKRAIGMQNGKQGVLRES